MRTEPTTEPTVAAAVSVAQRAIDGFIESLSLPAADKQAACFIAHQAVAQVGMLAKAIGSGVEDANAAATAGLAIALKTVQVKSAAAEQTCPCGKCVALRRRASGRYRRLRLRLRELLQWAERKLA